MKLLHVEGWRRTHHSYAMVNQWQLLALLKRRDISLRLKDLPFYDTQWQKSIGLFGADDENSLSSIGALGGDEQADVTYRISYPFDFSCASEGVTAVFGTSEYQFLDRSRFSAPFDFDALSKSERFFVITPSNWSRHGFLRLGLREAQVRVVPHGVASQIFYPAQTARAALREKLKLTGFVFANVSAMTDNKGIDILLRAFASVSEKRPNIHLLLKGVDGLYSSKDYLLKALTALPANAKDRVAARLLYDGSTMSTERMADFYRAADAYVSPYRAEGFNLPALEALACGTPIICTAGGPTDDFLDDRYALFVNSKGSRLLSGGVQLEPDIDSLTELMFKSIDAHAWRSEASRLGANHAAQNFNWDAIAARLLGAFDGLE